MSDWIIDLFGMSYREIWTFSNIFSHLKNIFTGFSFKGFIASVVAICDLLTMLLFSAPVPPRGQELNLDDYQLVFVDEFDQDELDTDKWYVRNPGPVRSGYHSESQVEVRDGNLIITGEYLENGEFGSGWYTSAVALREKYKTGYFEIRCKVNPSKVFWSAFWLQSPSIGTRFEPEWCGIESDIMEYFHIGKATSGNIYGGYGKQFTEEARIKYDINDDGWHYFGMDWQEDGYIFYCDGKETARCSDHVSHVPQFILLTTEVHGYRASGKKKQRLGTDGKTKSLTNMRTTHLSSIL